MTKNLLKMLPVIIFWIVFVFVIFQVPYPENLTQANLVQITSFFIPLYLGLSLTLNLFLKKISISTSISLGIIFILVLQALDSLNLVTGILILVSVYLLVSYFKNEKSPGLTNIKKISKLTHQRKRNE